MDFSSFLGLSCCGEDFKVYRHSCGYLADCRKNFNRFKVGIAFVISLLHDAHLRF